MKRFLLASAFALVFTSAAFAGNNNDNPGNQGGGNGGCGVGQQTNGCGANGGQGGQGGAGGSASQGQLQGQLQGQDQHQKQSQESFNANLNANVNLNGAFSESSSASLSAVRNSGNNVGNASAAGGSASAEGGAASAVNGDVTATNTATSGDSAASASANNSGNSTLVYSEARPHKPSANTAYAAPGAIGGGVCAYTPASVGVMGRAFGFSGQGAKIDKGCERRANADLFARLGETKMACELLMNNKEVADTAKRTGFKCEQNEEHEVSAAPAPQPVRPASYNEPGVPPALPLSYGERG